MIEEKRANAPVMDAKLTTPRAAQPQSVAENSPSSSLSRCKVASA